MIKVLKRLGIQGAYFNIIKVIYSKLTANINLNREKLKTILLKLATEQGCQLSTYLLNIVLEVLAGTIRPPIKIKGIYNQQIKYSTFLYFQIFFLF